MKLQFVSWDNIAAIKSNLSQYAVKFSCPSNDWITEALGCSPFSDTKYNLPEFQLDMSEEKPFLTEAKNAQLIYENLKFLSDSQASDERIWAGLCLGPFWKYVQYRWDIKNKCTNSNIEQHYFFGFGVRRSLTRNAISRLWWIGRLTYDENRADPYELTKFVCENADYIMHILERNTSNNPMIIRSFLSAILKAREEGININTDMVGELAKYLNLLGGTYILDCLPPEKIFNKTLDKIHEITKEKRDS